jgi:hypothetical protein
MKNEYRLLLCVINICTVDVKDKGLSRENYFRSGIFYFCNFDGSPPLLA